MHGHDLLIEYILKDFKNNINLNNKIIIEIGSTREYHPGQNSSEALIKLCIKYNMKIISVDMDPKCSQNVINIANKYNFINYEVHTMKGEDFLKKYDKDIDYIYLDAFDYDHGKHSNKRKESYKKNLNCNITNELCHKMHLECCKNIINKLNKNSIICFDDIKNKNATIGKGVLAVPYLLKNKLKIIEYRPHCMIFKL